MARKVSIDISVRSFITAVAVIFGLMVISYVLTFVIPSGEYARTINEAGNTIIDTQAGFTYTEGGLPFWKWIFSPFLVLAANGSSTLIAIIIFLLVIGGAFTCLDKSGILNYMLELISHRYGSRRYTLMTVVTLIFMMLGALVGSFEEVVPMVPIVVALAVSLGWDELTGMAMSLLAVGCGSRSLKSPVRFKIRDVMLGSTFLPKETLGIGIFSGWGQRVENGEREKPEQVKILLTSPDNPHHPASSSPSPPPAHPWQAGQIQTPPHVKAPPS